MMNSGMVDSLLSSVPIIVLVFACVGIVWSVLKKRKYLIGFVFLLLGGGIHYWGLYVGEWEGMGISLFFGGGIVLLGLLTLLLTFVYSKIMVAN
ncbi:hypothetical protein SAMN04487936_103403 [Halobacillus dabanensis]|uniref:YesK-like protein n=1 Tax=Halobacillus dabanensis TaxID=240302 RepID=A0A1I3TM21_HALDA|nr:hypothetical protein [Halobacillus dabanensis]SFJ70587.1 hypothetical protein SAMN04487936_103403 [Halobacillus dabanensis]